jgi:hypothetical protein
MVVAGKPVLMPEFVFIAQKNGEADFENAKSLREYVTMFKNFKLKVADAEAQGLDTTAAFRTEFESYKNQLENNYMNEAKGGDEAKKDYTAYPEYRYLLQEYRDGILLFELSNRRVWSQPVKKQEALEKKWIEELNETYTSEVNWPLIGTLLPE